MRRLLCALLLTLSASSTAWAQPARGVAWAWVSGPTVSVSYQYNSAGGAITVTNPTTGNYLVSIPNMGTSGGMAQVVAYGGNHYCNISAWGPAATTQQVALACYNAAGVLANGAFSVFFYKEARANAEWSDGYLWANEPSTASYTPAAAYQWNSRGGSNTVVRTGVGRYTATFPGLGPLAALGGVMVSAYGSANRCRAEGWGGSPNVIVNVACDTPGGVPVDAYFDVSFMSDTAFGVNQGQEQLRGAFVWADDPTAASYVPSLFYQYNSAGGTIRARRTAVGQYEMDFPGLIAFGSSNVQVVRYQGAGYCNVGGWGSGPNSGTTVYVSCYSTAGAPQDARYALTYLTSQPATAQLPAAGGPARAKAWVWSNGTGSNPTPSAPYQFNSAGFTNTITKLFTGAYRVDLPGLGTAGGIVHVNAYGGTAYCKVHSWGPNGTTQEIYVMCFNPAGSVVDSQFSVLFYKEARTGSNFNAGFSRSFIPIASAAVTPPSAYSWNGHALANTVLRVGVGRYSVTFTGHVQSPDGGTVMVTPYGSVPTRCKVEGWGTAFVNVRCYAIDGTLTDAPFGISYVSDVAFGSDTLANAYPGAYAWADSAATPSYQPSSFYRHNSTGGTFLATRSAVGTYSMEFGLQKAFNKSVPIVTAYGTAAGEAQAYCRPTGWVTKAGDPGTAINIGCFNAAGVAVDSRYTVAYLTTPADDDDGDTLPDSFETSFGLDPLSGLGANGASGDPDGDGRTNAQELADGTHPNGTFQRYLAEGATSTFFQTRIALLNPGVTTAHVQLRYLKGDGSVTSQVIALPSLRRQTVDVAGLAGLATAEFSTVLEADATVVIDRTMTWDATSYGSHAETGVPAPGPIWYLAEGSTAGPFSLFYLLQNPSLTQASNVRITFLRPNGTTVVKTYTVGANTRSNIWVNTIPELGPTDVSGVVETTNGVPIIVERAMYLSTPTQVFAAGHESAGIAAPATSWYLAEGATGPFFDEFVLIANPNSSAAVVRASFLLPTGTVLTKDYAVPATSRFNIWVDEESFPGLGKALADTAVSVTLVSQNGVSFIAERAMWWPGPTFATWAEAHNSPGATVTGTRWALAEGEVGGPNAADTYILLANTSVTAGSVKVTLRFEDGTSAEKTFAVPALSRFNVWVQAEFPAAVGKRFGAIIESLGGTPAQLVVERAMYSNAGGVTWAAGTNALATRLP